MKLNNYFSRLIAVVGIMMTFAITGLGVCVGTLSGTWNTGPTASTYTNTGGVLKDAGQYYTITVTADGDLNLTVINTDSSQKLTPTLYPDGLCVATPIWSPGEIAQGGSATYTGTDLPAGTYTLYLIGSHASQNTTYLVNGSYVPTPISFDCANPENFKNVYQENVYGDIKIIGNTNICKNNGSGQCVDPGTEANNNIDAINKDGDLVVATSNSSSAKLELPAGAKILWAGLFWQGYHESASISDDLKNASRTMKLGYSANNADLNIPYSEVIADEINWVYFSDQRWYYQGYAVVTDYVAQHGAGWFWGADINLQLGTPTGGTLGAWSIAVAYEDPADTIKNLTIYKGYLAFASSGDVSNAEDYAGDNGCNTSLTGLSGSTDILLDGFLTPAVGPVDSRLIFFAGEGDIQLDGDSLSITDENGVPHLLSDAVNPEYNIVNSSISDFGVHRDSTLLYPRYGYNTIGIDIDTFDVSDIIGNSQSQTNVHMQSTGDGYFPGAFGLSTELYQPQICYTETIYDKDGNPLTDGAEVAFGDEVKVVVYLKNEDNETANQVQIYRTFDSDFTYKQASTKEDNDYNGIFSAATDMSGDDIFTFLETTRNSEQLTGLYMINLGDGATASTGGDFPPQRESQFEYYAFTNSDHNYTVDYNIAYVNPITGELYSGSLTNKCTDFNNSFWARRTSVYTESYVDVVDAYSGSGGTYDSDIYTKVSGKGYTVDGVYLGEDVNNPTPQPYHAPDGTADNKAAPLYIYLKLADMSGTTSCSAAPTVPLQTSVGSSEPALIILEPGSQTATSNAFTMAYSEDDITKLAKRDVRFKYKSFDYNSIISNSNINCVDHSTEGGGIDGLPQCMTSESLVSQAAENYKAVFGVVAFERCWSQNGEPCLSSNGGVGSDPYDNNYGCLECSLGDLPYVCSKDNFAIRPEKFTVDNTDASYPDLLRSGRTYGLSVNAVDYDGVTNSLGYTRSSGDLSVDNLIKYFFDDTVDDNNTIPGDATWGLPPFSIVDGKTYVNGVESTAAYVYDEVGKITIHIEDQNFSAVDIPDTPATCDPDGRYVCGDRNVTYIPDHFDVAATLVNAAGGNSFTYLSAEADQSKMSARYNVTITAENALNQTTTNFREDPLYYENNISVNLTAPTVAGVGTPTVHNISPSVRLGFVLGVGNVVWNDAVSAQQLSFQYPRATNIPVNPFRIEGNQTVVDVDSVYTGIAPEGTANITGTDNSANANVTFVYGRVHAPRYRAMCSGGSCAANVTYFYEFYADKDANATLITSLLGTGKQRSVDSVNWYRNSLHNTATDGNVTASATNIPVSPTPVYVQNGATTTTTYNYTGSKGYPFKGSATVSSAVPGTGTQSWLIYDQYSPDGATQKQIEVEYYGPGKWTTTGDLETHSEGDTTKSKKTNRRIRW